jgi:diaminohydroxyphosphoribosylaminopyrimidine deaminase/5-amino-6-(5-phosphoribosylamino)uracil reductase
MFTDFDRRMMTRALELAQRGLYTTDPNPRVGCVITQGERVVGEGWHRKAGEPHAEVYALEQAGAQAGGATAYVTLEPCNHHGRTPPCSNALVQAGVTRVIAALGDPNPLVNGGGFDTLRAAGIEVQAGLFEAEARELNIGFVKRMQTGLPWVRVKIAASLDGRIALANGSSRWITNEASRVDVQRWRARSSAVLTGVGTVLADDPQLNVRAADIDMLGRQLWRVVCDTRLRTPASARLLQAPGVLLFTSQPAHTDFQNAEVVTVAAEEQGLDLREVLKALARRGCNEVLVEAGPTLNGRLLECGLVDELLVYVAPLVLGPDALAMLHLPQIESMSARREFALIAVERFGDDVRLQYRVKRTP